MRDLLFELVNPDDSEAEQRAMVDEFFIRMMNDVHPASRSGQAGREAGHCR